MREIDFEKVNKFGYEQKDFWYPITTFGKEDESLNLCEKTSMIIMVV